MKTLVNKNNPQIRITAPEIESYREFYTLQDKDFHYLFKMEDWTLVEEEPEKMNCPFDKGDCKYCTVQFCGKREDIKTITAPLSKELAKTITDQINAPACKDFLQVKDASEEEHPDNFTHFEWLVGRLMFRGCDLWGMTDGEDDNGVVTKLIKDRAAEMMKLLERELDTNAEPVDLEKEIDFEKEWKEYYNNHLIARLPMNKRQLARHFYELGLKRKEG